MTVRTDDPSTWIRRTSGGIPYAVISSEGAFEKESSAATEVYLIEADRLLDFAREAFPAPYLIGTKIVYPAPPTMPGLPLIPQKVSWKAHVDGKPIDPFNFHSNAPSDTYGQFVRVTVNYVSGTTKQGDPEEPFTFLEISSSTTGEFLHSTAPSGKWEGSSEDGSPLVKTMTTPVSIIVPETQWDITFPQLPFRFLSSDLVPRARTLLGTVNSHTMPLLFNANPETVLFVGYSVQQQFTWRTANQPPFKLTLKFIEKHINVDGSIKGHNDYWKPDEGWTRLLFNGTDPTYRSSNLNALFVL